MAPSRGKGKARATRSSARTRPRDAQPAIPDVYQEMLDEVEPMRSESPPKERPLKRRRIAAVKTEEAEVSPQDAPAQSESGDDSDEPISAHGMQTVERSDWDSDEDDLDFEDVDLDAPDPSTPTANDENDIAAVSVAIDTNTSPSKRSVVRRVPLTRTEKARRLLIHKAHFVCLLGHCIYVNSRCNNLTVHARLSGFLTARVVRFLNPRQDDSQFGRDRSFMDGLRQATEALRGAFTVTESGMRKALWATDDDDLEMKDEAGPMDLNDFVKAAERLEGSQDTGNQLFCALLRSVGVEARIVCSLQTFPLGNLPAHNRTPQKGLSHATYATPASPSPGPSRTNLNDSSVNSSNTIGNVPAPRRRLGRPAFSASAATPPPAKKQKPPIRNLNFPVYWVEAFNAAHQKWITVDPIVTQMLNKPAKVEPPASYSLNKLTYAIAFEASGVARDVTRRYTKAYNAKTRRQRVESTENGTQWLRKALHPLRRRGPQLDRDQVEDGELSRREAREGLPSNVQDFKEHPYYALERHVRRHEVIHPRREVGRVNAGTNAKPRMEAVFRRQDILVCRSAQKWYRFGREVKEGEQPLKHITTRAKRDADEDDDTPVATALYSSSQTELYVPPPVVNGRVPRNAFGNLDIYVPSMIPAGGSHIRDPFAKDAARTLRIDFADAIIGFKFQGRHGTPIVEGIVIATEHSEALHATIDGFTQTKAEDASAARSLVALNTWKRFLVYLQIAQRVRSYGEAAPSKDAKTADESKNGGGFVPEVDEEEDEPLITAGQLSVNDIHRRAQVAKKAKKKAREETPDDDEEEDEEMPDLGSPSSDEGGGGFMRDDANDDDEDMGGGFVPEGAVDDGGGGGFVAEETNQQDEFGGGGFVPEEPAEEDGGGGEFIPDAMDEDDGGGGFVPEDDDNDDSAPTNETAHEPEREAEQPRPEPHNLTPPPSSALSVRPPADIQQQEIAVEPNNNINELSIAEPEHETPQAPAIPEPEPEDETDHGSLLSHDPEDDDAEPDWLESD